MVCGRDAPDKGSAVRGDGCGQRFNWREARPYTPNAGNMRQVEFTAVEPEEVQQVVHTHWHCDLCSEEIAGPRFRCINCPAFNTCLNCENRIAIEHPADHIFHIMFEPESQ